MSWGAPGDVPGDVPGEIAGLVALTNALSELDDAIAAMEAALKATKEQRRCISEVSIPELMAEYGISNITLGDGLAVSVSDNVYASIPAENKATAFAWLNSHGFGGLIKTEVIAKFGMGEKGEADRMMELLVSAGLLPEVKEVVHPQTLKAFLKEQIKKGSPIDLELFGANVVRETKLKKVK